MDVAMAEVDGPGSWATSPGVRRSMLGNRRRDTAPELALRRIVHRMGLRYRVDYPPLASNKRRRADLVFTRTKVAVFVDGCFWHGCPRHYYPSKSNSEYWDAKIRKNVERDRETDLMLENCGWQVIRVWEHSDPLESAVRIREAVRSRRLDTGA